jgi:hypothetical protein
MRLIGRGDLPLKRIASYKLTERPSDRLARSALGTIKVVHREAPKSILVHVLFGLRKLLGVATFALIIVLLGPKLFVLFDNPKNATVPAKLFEAREYVLTKSVPVLHRYVPTNIAGSNRSDWILIGLAIVVTIFSGTIAQRAQTAQNRRLLRKSAQAWRRKEGVKPGSKLDAELETTLRMAESGKTVNRQELLRVFAETKKKLDTFGREVGALTNAYVTFTDLNFDKIVLASSSNSFEFDNISYGNVGPVPEPSTWAMMLLGFAGIGFAYRRRRSRLAAAAA